MLDPYDMSTTLIDDDMSDLMNVAYSWGKVIYISSRSFIVQFMGMYVALSGIMHIIK